LVIEEPKYPPVGIKVDSPVSTFVILVSGPPRPIFDLILVSSFFIRAFDRTRPIIDWRFQSPYGRRALNVSEKA
jgi:hypothetical protein